MSWEADGRSATRTTVRSIEELKEVEKRPPLSHLPGETIHAALRHAALACPSRAAIRQISHAEDLDPITIDFDTYLRRVEQAANLFHDRTGGARPIVAIVAPFMPEAFIAAWGAALGGIYIPINPYLEFAHVAGIMNAAQANILVIATDAVGPGAWNRLPDLQAAVPGLLGTFRIGVAPAADDFSSSVDAFPSGLLSFNPAGSAEEDCAYLHTGGTTAAPKLVRHTHGGQLLQGWLCGTAMGSEEDGVIGHAMPNFHVGGAIAVGMRGIVFQQTVLTLTTAGFRDPAVVRSFWDIVERFGVTSITTAPTTAAAILDQEGEGPRSLRQFTTGGGPLSPALARSFYKQYGVHLREVWGGTEFHGILSFHFGGEVAPRLGSCGRIVPYHEVVSAILEGNGFVRLAEEGERGILIARGPTVIPGYVEAENDHDFFVENGPGGRRWASTGDVGRVDEDGFVWIFGREKDVIIRGGHNIDSATIDEAISTHPAVLHVAAVGKPCPTKGELPMIYVQARAGHDLTAQDVLAHAGRVVQERAAVPVECVIIDEMPMTAVGKVSKPPLRIDAVRRVVGDVLASTAPDGPVDVEIEDRGGRTIVTIDAANPACASKLLEALAPFTFTTELRAQARASGA